MHRNAKPVDRLLHVTCPPSVFLVLSFYLCVSPFMYVRSPSAERSHDRSVHVRLRSTGRFAVQPPVSCPCFDGCPTAGRGIHHNESVRLCVHGGYGNDRVPLLIGTKSVVWIVPMDQRGPLASYAGSLIHAPHEMRQRLAESMHRSFQPYDMFVGPSPLWDQIVVDSHVSSVLRVLVRVATHIAETIQKGWVPVYVHDDVSWIPYMGVFETLGNVLMISDRELFSRTSPASALPSWTRRRHWHTQSGSAVSLSQRVRSRHLPCDAAARHTNAVDFRGAFQYGCLHVLLSLGQIADSGSAWHVPGYYDEVQFTLARTRARCSRRWLAAFDPSPVLAGMGDIGADSRPSRSPASRASSTTDRVFYSSPSARRFSKTRRHSHEADFVDTLAQEMTESTWPGLPHCSNFSARISGLRNVATGGAYNFWMGIDGGSMLYLSDSFVMNNDGCHSEMCKDGVRSFTQGEHPSGGFFENTGAAVTRWASGSLAPSFGLASLTRRILLKMLLRF